MGELSVPWMDDEAIRGNRIDSNCGLEGIESKVFGHRPGFRTIRRQCTTHRDNFAVHIPEEVGRQRQRDRRKEWPSPDCERDPFWSRVYWSTEA